jgi:pimeloyl-ACP methyl ester carboxylesterase
MSKVLFLHGWSSDGGNKSAFMRSLGYDVMTPRLSDWFFSRAVRQAQAAYDNFKPDVVVGSSRGGAVAMALISLTTHLILLAPAWRRWGKASSVKKNCVVIHSPHDEYVPFEDSVELCEASGVCLVPAGVDHRLNCWEARKAMEEALGLP